MQCSMFMSERHPLSTLHGLLQVLDVRPGRIWAHLPKRKSPVFSLRGDSFGERMESSEQCGAIRLSERLMACSPEWYATFSKS